MWSTLHLQTMTPVFNSDGDLRQAEIRVPSLRGGMRVWLRAMAGVLVGDQLHRLRRIEDRVLGATDHASPIRLRIYRQPDGEYRPSPDFLADPVHNKWIGYLLGPGLTTRSGRATHLARAYVPAGKDFKLQVRLVGDDHDAQQCALAALWLSLTYGGIGARTRRGFGAVRITGTEGPLPEKGWFTTDLNTPDLDHYSRVRYLWPSGPAEAAMRALSRIATKVGATGIHHWDSAPTYPVLSKKYTLAAVNGGEASRSWQDALALAGRELRYFRAEVDDEKRGPKTLGWEEVIKGDEVELPMAALGLPLIYDKGNEVHVSEGEEKLRRASPLWLRPVGADHSWRLFSFAFLNKFLPGKDQKVHVWKDRQRGKELTVNTEHAHALVKEWIGTLARGDTFMREDPRFR
ncbi:type III-B CRISPR module RAMP protein Cmr1 [Nocardiopsis alba]|uniref:type III-B CRISPR module RAMP protein Cmr1 n=1 Tax=Nocardiopsis alba TaxID=53437 RepID=UPI003640ADED